MDNQILHSKSLCHGGKSSLIGRIFHPCRLMLLEKLFQTMINKHIGGQIENEIHSF